jgi:hypothetical protein
MGEVVHGVNAPGFAGAVVFLKEDAVHGGSRMLKLGLAMSIFMRRIMSAFGVFAPFISANRRRLSSAGRSRQGLFLPGSVSVPR